MDQTDKALTAAYHSVFTAGEGATILADLEERFFDIVPYEPGVRANINDTIFYEGGRALVEYIHLRLHEHEHGTPAVADESTSHGTYV